MDASEFFNDVVNGNYQQFTGNTGCRRLLWNAIVSMNTTAEYLALDQLNYEPVARVTLDQAAKKIRDGHPILADLKYCADTFKHVRKIKDHPGRAPPFTTVATSTGVSDPTTWKIDQHDLVQVLHQAYAELSAFPELK